MNNTTQLKSSLIITAKDLLEHWKGHRNLTRRTIEAFPEMELFQHSIGGMRPFADMIKELLAIAGPGLKEMAIGEKQSLNEHNDKANTKAKILELWDESTADIQKYWSLIPEERFQEKVLIFGQYEGTIWSSIFYFIDNEIHHRAQGFVYLRSLGITPPAFYER